MPWVNGPKRCSGFRLSSVPRPNGCGSTTARYPASAARTGNADDAPILVLVAALGRPALAVAGTRVRRLAAPSSRGAHMTAAAVPRWHGRVREDGTGVAPPAR